MGFHLRRQGKTMSRSDPRFRLERQRREVDRYLLQLLEKGDEPPSLREAMRHSVAAGGKRLRPLLVIAAAETFGYPAGKVMPVAAAMELVHTYSLIHDDLPAMDDGVLRRGRPTCHRIYGEALAILAGDALLTLAFEEIASFGLSEGQAGRALRINRELARAAGREGMVGGQVLDLQTEGRQITLPELEKIDSRKTGALLQAAVRCGAIAATAGAEALKNLSDYGTCLGLAFQITDDLLDREGEAAALGKDTGADEARGKATMPALIGAAEARRRAEGLYRRALGHLDALGRPAESLAELARQLVYRNS